MGIDSLDLVTDKAFKFGKRIEELKSKEYYSDDPKKLIALFGEVIKQISESVRSAGTEDILGVKRISLLLSFYHLLLDEIEHIEVDNVPVEMLPLFRETLKQFQLETVLVFRPNPMYNYSYRPVTRVINEINKSQNYPEIKSEYDIAVISFPSSEKNSALLHCSFAHEIGHHLNESYSVAQGIESRILELLDKDLLKKYVGKLLESLSKTKRVIGTTEVTLDKFVLEVLEEQLISTVTEEFAGIIRKWLDECISDIFAVYLFGPAYVFAITEFLMSTQEPEKYSVTHPPLFIRLKNLMKLFDELDFPAHLKPYPDVVKRIDFYKEISKRSFESKSGTMSEIRNVILERGIGKLFDSAKDLVASRIDLSKKICNFEDVAQAVLDFRNLIPGNEILNENGTSRPIDPISILNASWIVRINFVNELYDMLPRVDKSEVRNILDELTLKSLDLQEFHRKMV